MQTRLCGLLGIDHPIIQAGMGAFTDARLVAAASNAGALGSLGTGGRSPEQLTAELAGVRERTERPFAVNFLVSDFNEASFATALAAEPAVISFALGDAGRLVQRCHDSGAKVIQQVHTVAQAEQAAANGVDVIIAQGGEAGGFGQSVAALPLIPQVVDAVGTVPVVAAGGIADGRGIAATLVLGAEGVNLGTRFLASEEAPIPDGWKRAILEAVSEDSVKVDFWNDLLPTPGRAGYGTIPRALRTPFHERWSGRSEELREQVDAVRGELLPALMAGRFHEYVPFAGETVGLIHDLPPVAEIIRRLISEADEALRRACERWR